MFELVFTQGAREQFDRIQSRATGGKALGLLKQVAKALKLLRENPRHPGLATHVFTSLPNPYNAREKVFEAYAQNNTPAAYRIFWCYGPRARQITVIAITPHP